MEGVGVVVGIGGWCDEWGVGRDDEQDGVSRWTSFSSLVTSARR